MNFENNWLIRSKYFRNFDDFLSEVSDKSHSAENHEESCMLSKRLKLEKSRMEKTPVFGYSALTKPYLKTKNLTMPKILKGGGTLWASLKIQFGAKYQKNWRETSKKFRKKSLTKPKKIRRGPLVSSGFANAQKSFWLQQRLEPATAGVINQSVEVTS